MSLLQSTARRWTPEDTQQTVRIWADLTTRLMILYSSRAKKHLTMWSRVPGEMAAAAQQTTGLGAWWTLTLQCLQLKEWWLGKVGSISSLSSAFSICRAHIHALPARSESEAERRALLILVQELSLVTAYARQSYEQHRADREAEKAAQAQAGMPTEEQE